MLYTEWCNYIDELLIRWNVNYTQEGSVGSALRSRGVPKNRVGQFVLGIDGYEER